MPRASWRYCLGGRRVAASLLISCVEVRPYEFATGSSCRTAHLLGARLALQRRMGLLPKRGIGSSPGDSLNPHVGPPACLGGGADRSGPPPAGQSQIAVSYSRCVPGRFRRSFLIQAPRLGTTFIAASVTRATSAAVKKPRTSVV